MALVPKINICLNSTCDTITLYDITGEWVEVENPEGWGEATIGTAQVETATLIVTDADGEEVTTFDVIDFFPFTVADSVELGELDWEFGDGVYNFQLVVGEHENTYEGLVTPVLFYCNAENCINKRKLSALGACDEKKFMEVTKNITLLEALLYGAKSAFACGNFTQTEEILETMSTLCTQLDNCGCGC